MVLCLGSFAESGKNIISAYVRGVRQGLRSSSQRYEGLLNTQDMSDSVPRSTTLEDEPWGKARLLSGSIMSSNTIEAV